MIEVARLVDLQTEAVARWHLGSITNESSDFDFIVLANHEINFRLWHEEDLARDPGVSDTLIAQVKQRIDRLNQQRSDSIEMIDNVIAEEIAKQRSVVDDTLPMNTESPGSAFDRLSILSLRLFHLSEQAERPEIDVEVRDRVNISLRVAEKQRTDLAKSLQQLIDDYFAGRKYHQTFRQLKMYNDPELNPVIYNRNKVNRGPV